MLDVVPDFLAGMLGHAERQVKLEVDFLAGP